MKKKIDINRLKNDDMVKILVAASFEKEKIYRSYNTNWRHNKNKHKNKS